MDITGLRFGRLVVVRQADFKGGNGNLYWECLCDCGNTKTIMGSNLLQGKTVSCGCYRNEVVAQRRRTHGDSYSRLYYIWIAMNRRCGRIGRYKRLRVCDEWKAFEPFRDWAIANGYQENLTIDRIDNERGYEPSNCRWATYKQQANNTSVNLRITVNGETHTPSEWEEITGIKQATIRYRWHRGRRGNDLFAKPYTMNKNYLED